MRRANRARQARRDAALSGEATAAKEALPTSAGLTRGKTSRCVMSPCCLTRTPALQSWLRPSCPQASLPSRKQAQAGQSCTGSLAVVAGFGMLCAGAHVWCTAHTACALHSASCSRAQGCSQSTFIARPGNALGRRGASRPGHHHLPCYPAVTRHGQALMYRMHLLMHATSLDGMQPEHVSRRRQV